MVAIRWGNHMPKHVGVKLERINNKKSTTSYSICWSSYIQYCKMLGSTIKTFIGWLNEVSNGQERHKMVELLSIV
jgi:hypothetical protein